MGETLCTLSTTMERIGLLDYERELLLKHRIRIISNRNQRMHSGNAKWSRCYAIRIVKEVP